MNADVVRHFYYNGVRPTEEDATSQLHYYGHDPEVSISLPAFEASLGGLSDRILDALELAAYVFCADRMTRRGGKSSANSKGWTRRMHHHMKVRDEAFWSDPLTQRVLVETLSFMSGDHHAFEFESGHGTPPGTLFDSSDVLGDWPKAPTIVMFSGGLDSTTGIYGLLKNTTETVVLVSHHSRRGKPRPLRNLVDKLSADFPERLKWHCFDCHLRGATSTSSRREETQRTRSFLYAAVGLAVAVAYGSRELVFFENGITSVNLPPAQHYLHARASRTTHPRVVDGLMRLFRLLLADHFEIRVPFLHITKTEVLQKLLEDGGADLVSMTISCSRTFDRAISEGQSHCGRCSQCIDRRIAVASSGAEQFEVLTSYAHDFVVEDVSPDTGGTVVVREERAMLMDYLHHVLKLSRIGAGAFEEEWCSEIEAIEGSLSVFSGEEGVEKLRALHFRHAQQVIAGIERFYSIYSERFLNGKFQEGSLFDIVRRQEYLKDPYERFADEIIALLRNAYPRSFRANRPKNEVDLHDKTDGILNAQRARFEREYPSIRFSVSKATPDIRPKEDTLYIEVKYVRNSVAPRVASKGIAEACTRYKDARYVLFPVYDPDGRIPDEREFAADFEEQRQCKVAVIR